MNKNMSCCLLVPFLAAKKLLALALAVARRIAFIAAGLLLIGVGLVVSFTIVGAVVGIPLILLGIILLIRGVF